MLDCIRAKKDTEIQKASESIIFSFRFYDYLPCAPVVDKNLLLDTLQNLRRNGKFKKVPFMISFNSHEAGILELMVNSSFELTESVDNGVNPALFESFLTKFAHAANSGQVVKVIKIPLTSSFVWGDLNYPLTLIPVPPPFLV